MQKSTHSGDVVRFGLFEADLRSGELRKNGARVKIQELPFRALRLLLSRPLEVVTREDLRKALWPDGVFVDFDHGISSAINRLRDALGDSAENPIFVETVERRGYRWIAPIHQPEPTPAPTTPVAEETPVEPTSIPTIPTRWSLRKLAWGLPILALALAAWLSRSAVRSSASTNLGRASTVVQGEHHPADPEAEEFYLKGRFYWNKRTPEDLNKALDYFMQAIVHDPGYAKSYVGLADCYNLLREYTMMPATEAYPRALAAARKAVELDPQSSAAHASVAFAAFYGMWDATTADAEFRKAIALDPNNATAHHWYATFLATTQHVDEALKEIERAQSLEPSSRAILADRGDLLAIAGHTPEAISLLKQIEATEPAFISPHRYLKIIYQKAGDDKNYLAEAREEATLLNDRAGLAITAAGERGLARAGTEGMLRGMLEAEKQYYEQGQVPAYRVAQTYAQLGRNDEALRYLKVAVEKHEESVVNLPGDSSFQRLHTDAKFRALIAQAGLPAATS